MPHQTGTGAQPIPFFASRHVRAALARLGRPEDICFSPDGTQLALLGLVTNRLLLLDVEISTASHVPSIALTGFMELESSTFHQPHGIVWTDDDMLVTGNRRGNISIFKVPEETLACTSVAVDPIRVIGSDGLDLITTPGSLSLRPIGMGLAELLVCNNYVDYVTRHLIDQRDGYKILASEILIDDGVSVPDGVAPSPSGQWIAISNHSHRNVLLYRNHDQLGSSSKADGILTSLAYPHGLKFSSDGRALLVADAGAPYVHIFKSEDGEWSGRRNPAASLRTLEDSVFQSGNHSPLEGGPKGIDLTADNRVMVATCEQQPLAFFDMGGFLPPVDPPPPASEHTNSAEQTRVELVKYLSAARKQAQQESEALRRAAEYQRQALVARELEIRTLIASRSWRLTKGLRWLNARIGKRKRR